MKYILAIDQSTSSTKAYLFDEAGMVAGSGEIPHEQKISSNGWVAHDPMEIYRNTLGAVQKAVNDSGIDKAHIVGAGICNQRETALVWDVDSGLPVYDAIVWQCARGQDICDALAPHGDIIQKKTGLPLSPYFSAAKIAWVLKNADVRGKNLAAGTVDSWLLFKLTGTLATEYSNASRTQLFDIHALEWDSEICGLFGIDTAILPQVRHSDSFFGETDFEGFLDKPVPIHAVLGDSQGALFGQGCTEKGMAKATYGTGSSVMLNAGDAPVTPSGGLVTSIAWGVGGKINYVIEGNINYTGAVIKWLVEDIGLISSPKEAGDLARKARPEDTAYLVPAFTGLGAPYWDASARAILTGMSRSTGKAELVRAAEECIAYQIADIVEVMRKQIPPKELRVDGGPTADSFLMQFQSDILNMPVSVPPLRELSAAGAAYAAGIRLGLYKPDIQKSMCGTQYLPAMDEAFRTKKYAGWKAAVARTLA